MGKLSDAIHQALQERKTTPHEFVQALSKDIPPSSTYNILSGSFLPREKGRIEQIAAYLGMDQRTLKLYFAYDKTQQLLDHLNIGWKDLTREQPRTPTNNMIPLYRFQDIPVRLDDTGKPNPGKKPPAYTPGYSTLSPHAYALTMPDARIAPKAEQGDILIFDPSLPRPENDDYALLRSRQGLYIGKIKKEHTKITIYTTVQIKVHTVPKSDLFFAHVIADVRKPI